MSIALRAKNQEWLPLDDLVLGLEGSFYDDETVRGANDDEEIRKVYYVPNTGLLGFIKALGVIIAPDTLVDTEKYLVKTHPRRFPKSMIQTIRTPDSDADGRPKYKKVLIRDTDGNQDYLSRINEDIGQELRSATKQKKQKEAETLKEKAKNIKSSSDKSSNSGTKKGNGLPV